MIPQTTNQSIEIIHDFLQNERQNLFSSLPSQIRVAIHTMLQHVAEREKEVDMLYRRIWEEQNQRSILETMLSSTKRHQTTPPDTRKTNFGGDVAIN